jgi:hypothetical protein
MPVHDVDVNQVGAGFDDGRNFFTETTEVTGEYGWGNLNVHWGKMPFVIKTG